MTEPEVPPTGESKSDLTVGGSATLDAGVIRWLITHKSCSDFPKCWAVAVPTIRERIIAVWGSDPWR